LIRLALIRHRLFDGGPHDVDVDAAERQIPRIFERLVELFPNAAFRAFNVSRPLFVRLSWDGELVAFGENDEDRQTADLGRQASLRLPFVEKLVELVLELGGACGRVDDQKHAIRFRQGRRQRPRAGDIFLSRQDAHGFGAAGIMQRGRFVAAGELDGVRRDGGVGWMILLARRRLAQLGEFAGQIDERTVDAGAVLLRGLLQRRQEGRFARRRQSQKDKIQIDHGGRRITEMGGRRYRCSALAIAMPRRYNFGVRRSGAAFFLL